MNEAVLLIVCVRDGKKFLKVENYVIYFYLCIANYFPTVLK